MQKKPHIDGCKWQKNILIAQCHYKRLYLVKKQFKNFHSHLKVPIVLAPGVFSRWLYYGVIGPLMDDTCPGNRPQSTADALRCTPVHRCQQGIHRTATGASVNARERRAHACHQNWRQTAYFWLLLGLQRVPEFLLAVLTPDYRSGLLPDYSPACCCTWSA